MLKLGRVRLQEVPLNLDFCILPQVRKFASAWELYVYPLTMTMT
jgi:hypothetical protein